MQCAHGYAKSDAMPTDPKQPKPAPLETGGNQHGGKPPLPPAAERALAEAEARRAAQDKQSAGQPKEVAGPEGLEPTRYGDWELNGIASDF